MYFEQSIHAENLQYGHITSPGLLCALLDVHQLPTLFHHFTLGATDSLDDTIRRSPQHRLRLHALKDDNHLALLHALANSSAHLDHKTGHRGA